MERGGIAVAIATVTGGFLVEDVGEAAVPKSAFYSTPQEAEAQGRAHEERERQENQPLGAHADHHYALRIAGAEEPVHESEIRSPQARVVGRM